VQAGPISIGMVAGDAADDRLAAELVAALLLRRPALRIAGIAGPKLQALGAQSYFPMEKLSPRARRNVFGRAPAGGDIRRQLVQRMLEMRPALYVGVGASAFSLAIARQLRQAGVPTVQYAGPPVWTWRGWRVRRLAACLTRALALFPFETGVYEQAGIAATYVGHPLADSVPYDVDKAAARTQLRLPHGKLIVTVMPGDATYGLRSIAEILIKAARRFHSEVKDVHFVIPTGSRQSRELLESTLRLHADGDLPLTLLFGHSHEALAAADLALVASEEASLEALLFKTPMVVAHRVATTVKRWTYRLSFQPYVSLPNRLAGTRLVPEVLQHQLTPWALAAALVELMRDTQARRRQTECFGEAHRRLRQDNAASAAAALLGMLDDASR
jgi:lipid-A-disaccharide synthase